MRPLATPPPAPHAHGHSPPPLPPPLPAGARVVFHDAEEEAFRARSGGLACDRRQGARGVVLHVRHAYGVDARLGRTYAVAWADDWRGRGYDTNAYEAHLRLEAEEGMATGALPPTQPAGHAGVEK